MRPSEMRRTLFTLCLALLLTACGRAPTLPVLGADDVILAFGDTLTYGTGAEPHEAYPAQLADLTKRRVINAGLPGETTADGLQRLPAALAEHRPQLVLLCLGGNDMLQRMADADTENNLRGMLQMLRTANVDVVLVGVPEPRLFGGAPDYYARLAEEFDVPYDGETMNTVLKDNALKSDPIHPNAAGYRMIAQNLATLLKQSGAL